MFITETFAREYIEKFIDENINLFQNKKIYLHSICEMGIYLYELFTERNIEIKGFSDFSQRFKGKTIYGIPVTHPEELDEDVQVIIASTTIANREHDNLMKIGISEASVLRFYPQVIDYFHDFFLSKDKERYQDLSREDNKVLRDKEHFKEIELKSLPSQLILDLTTKCNLNCVHCTDHHNKEVSKYRNQAENYLNFDRYSFLFDYLESIYLNISGEPLMTPKFFDVLDQIDESDNEPYLFTITNGLLLNEKNARRIVHSKFKMITVSMDAATEITYSRLRRGGDFKTWIKNVGRFVELRNESGRKDLEIRLLYTVQRENLSEIPQAVQIAVDLGIDYMEVHPLYDNIAGKESWLIDVDDSFQYYYPQQNVEYYPHLLQKVLKESEEIAEGTKLTYKISPRFETYTYQGQDLEYPMNVSEFIDKITAIEAVKQVKQIEASNTLNIKDIDYCELCNNPWSMAMIFLNGNMMHCNRMNQPQANINFSSYYDIHNSRNAINIRKGLLERDLSWDCYYCSGCEYGDAVKRIPRKKVYFQSGDVLEFNLNNTDALREVDYTGVSRIQRYGAWNNLRKSDFHIPVKEDERIEFIDVTLEAFVIPGMVDKQDIHVYVNKEFVDHWSFNDDKVKTMSIPVKEYIDGEIQLTFEYLNPKSPLGIGLSRDDRERSLFFYSLELK